MTYAYVYPTLDLSHGQPADKILDFLRPLPSGTVVRIEDPHHATSIGTVLQIVSRSVTHLGCRTVPRSATRDAVLFEKPLDLPVPDNDPRRDLRLPTLHTALTSLAPGRSGVVRLRDGFRTHAPRAPLAPAGCPAAVLAMVSGVPLARTPQARSGQCLLLVTSVHSRGES